MSGFRNGLLNCAPPNGCAGCRGGNEMGRNPTVNTGRFKRSGQRRMQSSMPRQFDHQSKPTRYTRAAYRAELFGAVLAMAVVSMGCVTQGDFLRLQERVAENHQASANEPDPFTRIAKLSADVEALRQEIRDVQGDLELARKEAADARIEARLTRAALADSNSDSDAEVDSRGGEAGDGAGNESMGGAAAFAEPLSGSRTSPDQELAGYQEALDAWRQHDFAGCIERFTTFLQKHPTSGYSDDAAYWLADCTYKNDEFKRAVVRFNAVVSVSPDSPKAPDALFRQGESLLKLGPKFHEAARTVFKKVQKDYPESERAAEAARQLERLGAG